MKKFILLASLLGFGCSDGCANQTQEVVRDASCQKKCAETRVAPDTTACESRCRKYTTQQLNEKQLYAYCADQCKARDALLAQRHAAKCEVRCIEDRDLDGVYGLMDKCPKTSPGVKVAANGCQDKDDDGVPDGEDKCPEQGGDDIAPDGCPVAVLSCPGGYCSNGQEPQCSGAGCDKEQEIPLLDVLSEETRKTMARTFLSLRPSPTTCPDTGFSQDAPLLLEPHVGISRQQEGDWYTGPVYFNEVDGKLIPVEDDDTATEDTVGKGKNQVIPVKVEFSSVSSQCPPVRYSLKVSYYFCETLPEVEERGHYHELGFCKWLPLDYVSGVAPDKAFFYPVKVAELFARLYQPHFKKASVASQWTPNATSGKIPFRYRTLWLNFQVIAHNANGVASDSGFHAQSAYRVIYTVAKEHQLTKIPSSAHQH